MVELFGKEFDNFELMQLLLIASLVMGGVFVSIEFLMQMKWLLILAVGAYMFYRFFGKKSGKKNIWEKMF